MIDYECRPAFIPFHQRTQREAVLVCHRRAGKTVCLVIELILRALANTSNPTPSAVRLFLPHLETGQGHRLALPEILHKAPS